MIGIVAFIFFTKIELKRNLQNRPVLLDLNLLRITSFRNANIAAAIVSLGEFGLIFSLPLWLQNVLGYSAFGTGLILLALAVGSFFASGAGGALGAKRGPIFVVRAGIFLELIGVLGIGIVISPTTKAWVLIIPLFIYGMGVGLATAQLTGVVLADVPVEQSGQASGMASTMRQLGSALGIAILGTVLFGTLGSGLNGKLEVQSQLPKVAQEKISQGVVSTAGALIPQLRNNPATAAEGKAAAESFSSSSKWAAGVASLFLLLGLLATRRLKEKAR